MITKKEIEKCRVMTTGNFPVDSFHGSIEETQGIFVELEASSYITNIFVLLALYTPEGSPESDWCITDIKRVVVSAKYGPTFELESFSDEEYEEYNESARYISASANVMRFVNLKKV